PPCDVRMARNWQQRLMEIRARLSRIKESAQAAPSSSKRAKEGRTIGANAEKRERLDPKRSLSRGQCNRRPLSTSILTGRCGPADGSCDGHSTPNGASGSNIPNRQSRDNRNRIRNHTDRNRHRRVCGKIVGG